MAKATRPNSLRQNSLHTLRLATLCIISLCSFLSSTDASTLQGNRSTDEDVTELISRLDANDYLTREQAMVELVNLGADAIRPLAIGSVSGSPETCWRIKKVLEQICTSGSEEDFYKCFGILEVRFGGGDERVAQKLASLKQVWEQRIRNENIKKLERRGAKIVDPRLYQALRGVNDPVFLNQRRLIADNFEAFPNSPNAKPEKKPEKSWSSKTDLRSMIEEILEADLVANRKRVMMDPGSPKKQAPSNGAKTRVFRNGVLVQQFNGMTNTYGALTVTLTKDWEGTPKDYELLDSMGPISTLTFQDQDVSRDAFGLLGQDSFVTNLNFENSKIKLDEWPKKFAPNLTTVQFSRMTVDRDLIEKLEASKGVFQVTLTECEFDDNCFRGLIQLDGLRNLMLNEVKLTESMFQSMASMPTLSYVSLGAAKFERAWLNRLQARRPSIRVNFSARAFLGVRGPLNVGIQETACEISDVIDGSGAEEAGLKVGDIIESADNEKVTRFEDLREIIAQKNPGDVLKLNIMRDGKKMKFDVTLKHVNTAPDE